MRFYFLCGPMFVLLVELSKDIRLAHKRRMHIRRIRRQLRCDN